MRLLNRLVLHGRCWAGLAGGALCCAIPATEKTHVTTTAIRIRQTNVIDGLALRHCLNRAGEYTKRTFVADPHASSFRLACVYDSLASALARSLSRASVADTSPIGALGLGLRVAVRRAGVKMRCQFPEDKFLEDTGGGTFSKPDQRVLKDQIGCIAIVCWSVKV